jgi:DNA-binding LytR/AlgR family response regulator
MSRVTALIAEDEPLMRERLKDKLAIAWPELDIVAEVADGIAAIEAFTRERPQIAFLDIRMPGKTGLEVAADRWRLSRRLHHRLRPVRAEGMTPALRLSVEAVEADRLAAAVERIKKKLSGPPADLSALVTELRATIKADVPRMKWIKAAIGKQIKLIAIGDVVYFQSDTKYTRVVMDGGEALIRTPLKELLGELDPERFWQIHRGTIVNLEQVAGVLREDAERQFVLLKKRTERLPISRQFLHLFKQM